MKTNTDSLTRPKAFLVISFLLAWLAMAGVLNFSDFISDNKMGLSIMNGWGALIFGATALFAAIGIFRFRWWAFPAIVIWTLVAVMQNFARQKFRDTTEYGVETWLFYSFEFLIYGCVVYYVFRKCPSRKRPLKDG